MAWAAFVDKALTNVCGLLLSVLMLKQIIMNLIDLIKPRCKKPKIFKKGEQSIIEHVQKAENRHHYSVENEDIDKEEHK